MEWISIGWTWVMQHHYIDITLRLFLAAALGGLVGMEREQSNRPAGLRTHILVCLGSALIMLISMYGFDTILEERSKYGHIVADPARLAAQVVSGIGFLGAGTILVHGFAVRGLTTAASLWVVAGVGLALGAGFYFGAVLSTALVLLSLTFLNRFELSVLNKGAVHRVEINVADGPDYLGKVAGIMEDHGIRIRRIEIEEGGGAQEGTLRLVLHIQLPQTVSLSLLIEQMRGINGVKMIRIDP